MAPDLSADSGLQERLLQPDVQEPAGSRGGPPDYDACENGRVEQRPEPPSGSGTVKSTVLNLATTAVGAGVMALPRAIATLGLAGGLGVLLAVWGLSYFALASLVRLSDRLGQRTYGSLVGSKFGRAGANALQVSILLNNFGCLIVYLIIIGDVLVGTAPSYSGLVTNLLGIHSGSVWYAGRPFVVGCVVVFLLVPLFSLKDISSLEASSLVSMLLALGFAITTTVLAVIAAVKGQVQAVHWLPDPNFVGKDLQHAVPAVLAVVPVVMMAYICHFTVHPAMQSMQKYTQARMLRALRLALLLCTIVYVLVGVSAYVLFGAQTAGDVLQNFTVTDLSPLIGEQAATVLIVAIRASYCFCLLATASLVHYGLRIAVFELWLQGRRPSMFIFYSVTWATAAGVFILAVTVPDMWMAMSLIGSTSAVTLAWIFPGLVALRTTGPHMQVFLGFALVVVGVCLGVIGILNTLVL